MENCCVFWGFVRIWFFSKVLHPNVTVFFPVCNAGSSLITMILAEVILCWLPQAHYFQKNMQHNSFNQRGWCEKWIAPFLIYFPRKHCVVQSSIEITLLSPSSKKHCRATIWQDDQDDRFWRATLPSPWSISKDPGLCPPPSLQAVRHTHIRNQSALQEMMSDPYIRLDKRCWHLGDGGWEQYIHLYIYNILCIYT